MNFNVNIDFKRGPSFSSPEVEAANKDAAIKQAMAFAVECGFCEAVRKATATPAVIPVPSDIRRALGFELTNNNEYQR